MSTTWSQSRAPKSKRQRATSKAMITSEDERELDMADIPQQNPAPAARKKLSLPTRLPPALRNSRLNNKPVSARNTINDDEGSEATPNPPTKKKYVEIDELDEGTLMNIGPAPKMGQAYVEIPPAPFAIAGAVSAGDHAADLTVWSPGCGPCVHRGLVCRQGYNKSGEALTVCGSCHRLKHKCGGNGSAAPTTKGRKPAATTTRRARSRSRRRPSPVPVSPETDDTAAPAAASTSGAPAPVVAAEPFSAIAAPTATAAPTHTATPSTAPITAPITSPEPATAAAPTTASSPDGPADESVLALKEQIEALQSTVASLEAKASIGEKRLLEANQRLANQEATSKLLAEQFQELRRQLLPPPAISANLSGNTKVIAEAEDVAESVSGVIADAEEAAESMPGDLSSIMMDVVPAEAAAESASTSGVIAGLNGNTIDVAEDAADSASPSGVIAGLSSNNMDVVEDAADPASPSGVIAGLSGNTKDVAEADDIAESASIASSAQE